ncbi:DUF397 domain-containing protein [Nocardia jejuensis]|uniref:DUF397 domain-containing protein n=1 Tax=Nocardia jejuensis TaxID=328049 RepID=UPI000A04EEBF
MDELSRAGWFKSSYSESSGACVEVAWLPDGAVGVRDSKNQTGPALVFAPAAWDAFTAALTRVQLDAPAKKGNVRELVQEQLQQRPN